MYVASFAASAASRDTELVTCDGDDPVVLQMAASEPETAAAAAKLLRGGPISSIDINCGCPQRWAISEGIGGALLSDTHKLCEIVKATREASGLPVSVKIRLLEGEGGGPRGNYAQTCELAQAAEDAGAAWVSVFGTQYVVE